MNKLYKMLGLPGALVVAITFAQPVGAVTIYNDSGTHNLSSPQGDVSVSNATTVNFLGGSSASGLTAATPSAAVESNGASTVLVNGGTLLGGNDTNGGFAGGGIRATDSSVVVNSGAVTGGNQIGSFGGFGIEASNSDIVITGGTIQGGNNSGGGFGGFGLRLFGGTLDISGGSISGGDGNQVAGRALFLSDLSGSISGGSFAIGAGLAGAMVSANNADLDILGGVFEAGKSWSLFGSSVFNVFGTGLMLTGTTSGTLSGSLLDGSSINVNYSLFDNAVININPQTQPVPEPGMLVLFGLGFTGLVCVRRRKSA